MSGAEETIKISPKKEAQVEWYFRWWVVTLAILATGPLGLLLVWFRPETKMSLKIIVSVIVLGFTVWMTISTVDYYQLLAQHYRELAEVMKQ